MILLAQGSSILLPEPIFWHKYPDYLQEIFDIFPALADAFAIIRIPCAAFFNHTGLDAHVDQIRRRRYAFAVHDVKFRFFKRRGHLVFHHFGFGAVADNLLPIFYRSGPADFNPDGRVKF